MEWQAAPRTKVIIWDRLDSPSVNILFTTKLLHLDLLSWDMDCLLTLWPILIPSSLGNGCCMFGFLIFIIVERNFLYNSLYILTERSSKHLCSIRAWVPVSFFLSFSPSLSLWLILWSVETVMLTLLAELPRPPRESALCLCERCKPCVKVFIGFLHKPGNISLFLSFTFLSSTLYHQVPVH